MQAAALLYVKVTEQSHDLKRAELLPKGTSSLLVSHTRTAASSHPAGSETLL